MDTAFNSAPLKEAGIPMGAFQDRRSLQLQYFSFSQVVPYVGDNQQYSQTLTGLQIGQTYHIQIQVLDRNSYVMYTSPEASARSSCSGT